VTAIDPTDPLAPTLPGLDAPAADAGRLELAVRSTIAAVDAAGLLRPRDAATCELALTLARTVAIGVASRRSTGAAMAARELRETLELLPADPDGPSDGGEWERLAAEMAALDANAAD
jgi:hypothetical protein